MRLLVALPGGQDGFVFQLARQVQRIGPVFGPGLVRRDGTNFPYEVLMRPHPSPLPFMGRGGGGARSELRR